MTTPSPAPTPGPVTAPVLRHEYVKLIAERDAMLTDLRTQWLAARTSSDRAVAMGKINANLDERSRLMRCRDAAASNGL